jgi:hypothetical protein
MCEATRLMNRSYTDRPSGAPRGDYRHERPSRHGSGAAGWCGGLRGFLGQADGASWGWLGWISASGNAASAVKTDPLPKIGDLYT